LLLSLRAGAAENVYITVIAITILCLAWCSWVLKRQVKSR
jgi:hypothetical protein